MKLAMSAKRECDDVGKMAAIAPISTDELLAELARRFRLRFGKLEVVFHDGRPSPRVLVEHRVRRTLADDE